MRACIQRVSRASVAVDGNISGEIGGGLLVLLGVASGDTDDDLKYLADKVIGLRIFADDEGKMNRSVAEVGGAVLVVSQFTLLGDCRKGRRPGYSDAAPPEVAVALYEKFCDHLRGQGITVATGRFREHMEVSLVNDGPVTLLVDSRKSF